MPDGANWMDAIPSAAPTGGMLAQYGGLPANASAAGPVASPAPAPQAAPPAPPQWDAVRGVGVLPDGSATRDPAVWARWMSQYQPNAPVDSGTVGPGATSGQMGAQPSTQQPPMMQAASTRADAPKGASWMDALPAAQPTAGMQAALGDGKPPSADTGIGANFRAGVQEGVAGLVGAPVWAANTVANLPIEGANALLGTHVPTFDPQAGFKLAKGAETWLGNLPARGINALTGSDIPLSAGPDAVQPTNQLERIARAGGAGAASVLTPWAVANALPELGGVAGALQDTFGSGGATRMGVAGATGGATGQELEDSAPAPLKPLANLAGNVIGAGAPLAAMSVAESAVPAAARLAGHYVQPLRAGTATTGAGQLLDRLAAGGRAAAAGQRIANAATDAGAVRNTLEDAAQAERAAAPLQAVLDDPTATAAAKADAQTQLDALAPQRAQIVPGSQPTTFQLTGDQGLGQLERTAGGGSGGNNPAFIQRAADQNLARVRQIAAQAPTDASPEAVGTAFRQQLAAIDAQGEQAIGAARVAAQQATSGLGGAVPVGADAQTSALQDFGQRLRGGLDAANQDQRAAVSRLYDQVDPEGKLTVDMAGIKAAARKIAAETPKNAAPMEGDAQAILGVAQMQPAVQPFSEVGALRSRITDAMRAELYQNGRSQTYRRLTQLLGAVDDTLSNGVEKATAADPDLAARIAGHAANEGSNGPLAGAGSGQELGAGAPSGTDSIPGPGGAVGAPGQRPGGPGSDSAMAPSPAATGAAAGAEQPGVETVPATFDGAAAARYRAANAAHAQRVSTFEEAPGVGAVLATGKRAGEWKLGDSQVAASIFTGGKGAAERVQAFLKAGGDNAALVSDLKDYAAFSLRRAAEDDDGTLNPGKFRRWMDAHAEALSALPDVAAQFRTAATAREAMDQAAAAHLAAREALQKSAAAKFMGDADPVRVIGTILRSDTAEATMRDLAKRTAGDPAARAGLKRAIVDHILGDLRTNTAPGDSGERALKADAFQTFLRRSEPALRQVFKPQEVKALQDVATDVQRAQRSISGSKIAGGANTAHDLAAMAAQHGGKGSMVSTLVVAEALGDAGEHVSGPLAKVLGMVAVPILNTMRQEGMRKIDDLVAEAMLHPELARALLAKVPTGGFGKSVVSNAVKQIRAIGADAAAREIMTGRKQ